MRFIIPGRPIGKGIPQHRKTGPYVSPAAIQYEKYIREAYENCSDGTIFPAFTPLRVKIDAFFWCCQKSVRETEAKLAGMIRPTGWPHIDNLARIILDSLEGVAFFSQDQVVEIEVSKHFAFEPRVEVEIDVAWPVDSDILSHKE